MPEGGDDQGIENGEDQMDDIEYDEMDLTPYEDDDDATLHKKLCAAKVARKRAEEDLKLLCNRIGLLKMEEGKVIIRFLSETFQQSIAHNISHSETLRTFSRVNQSILGSSLSSFYQLWRTQILGRLSNSCSETPLTNGFLLFSLLFRLSRKSMKRASVQTRLCLSASVT